MRYLLLSSVVLLVWCGCSPKISGSPDPFTQKLADWRIATFYDTTSAYLYKSKINLYGHYLSGLMLIKVHEPHHYKVAMTTEFGAKILDFEMVKGSFLLNDCIEQMKRKRILNMLETDMKLLLGVQSTPPIISKSDSGVVISYNDKPLSAVYSFNEQANLATIEGYKRKKRVVTIALLDNQWPAPKTIQLNHHNMPVQIELNLLKAPENVGE